MSNFAIILLAFIKIALSLPSLDVSSNRSSIDVLLIRPSLSASLNRSDSHQLFAKNHHPPQHSLFIQTADANGDLLEWAANEVSSIDHQVLLCAVSCLIHSAVNVDFSWTEQMFRLHDSRSSGEEDIALVGYLPPHSVPCDALFQVWHPISARGKELIDTPWN